MEYKYIIRYRFMQDGERKTFYLADPAVNPQSMTSYRESRVSRTEALHEAWLFDSESEVKMMLKNEYIKAGLPKIVKLTKKEVFKMALRGK